MNFYKKAEELGNKYTIKLAQEETRIPGPSTMRDVKDLVNSAYRGYVNKTEKSIFEKGMTRPVVNDKNIFGFLLSSLEKDKNNEYPNVKEIVTGIHDNIKIVYDNFDTLDHTEVFKYLNEVMSYFNRIGEVRDFIQTVFKNPKIHNTNIKNNIAVGAESVFDPLSTLVYKAVKLLLPYQGKDSEGLSQVINGEPIKRQRGELIDTWIIKYIREHGEKIGLEEKFDWQRALEHDLDLKKKLVTIVNATRRGHDPLDAGEAKRQIKVLFDEFAQRKQKNVDEEGELKESPVNNRLTPKTTKEDFEEKENSKLFGDIIKQKKQEEKDRLQAILDEREERLMRQYS